GSGLARAPQRDVALLSPQFRAGWEFYSTVPNSLLEIGGCARDTYWDGRACLGVTHSSQASAEHFQQCPEFLPLRNRGLGPLAAWLANSGKPPCRSGDILHRRSE